MNKKSIQGVLNQNGHQFKIYETNLILYKNGLFVHISSFITLSETKIRLFDITRL